MYTATFTEFSYGYAITDNILHSGLPHSPHAPIFPSLLAEGGSGGGYDVHLPLCPVPLFLQFKIPQVVRRRSTNMPAGFTTPYLRMHFRTKRPNQHKLLRRLEASGKLVYYVTPDFWKIESLDNYFSTHRVHNESWYIRPSAIGRLDSKAHCIAYELGNHEAWLCSKPKLLNSNFGSEAFAETLNQAVRSAARQEPFQFLRQLAQTISSLTRTEKPTFDDESARSSERRSDSVQKREPITSIEQQRLERRRLSIAAREVAYMAQVRLGCTLVITGSNEQ